MGYPSFSYGDTDYLMAGVDADTMQWGVRSSDGSFDNVPMMALSAYTTTATNITSGANVTWDVEVLSNSSFVTVSGTEITVAKSGKYKITFDMSTDISSGTSRDTSLAYLTIDDAEVTGSRVWMYNREDSDGENTGSCTLVVDLTAGEVVEVYAVRNSGSDTIVAISGSCRIMMEYIG
jgi:hypothetical protein